jgi:AcrR family transcriptional regulator
MSVQGSGRAGRERVLEAAYELFTRQGMAQVGVDAVIARAGTAKMTLYRHYGSRDELALAVLKAREHRWTFGWLAEETARRTPRPEERLLAIFDMFAEWFEQPDFEGCLFLTAMLEHGDVQHPIRQASVGHLQTIRGFLRDLAAEAGAPDPVAFARQWHVLMMGSILAAESGDAAAAKGAREMGLSLLQRHGMIAPGSDGRAAP